MRWSGDLFTIGRWLGVALLCGAVVAPLGPVAHAAGTSVTVNPPTSSVKPGDHFRLDVMVSSDTPTRGLQLGLKFDPRLVQIDRVQNGPFYSSWATANGGSIANPVPFRPNNNTGDVPPGVVVVLGGPPSGGASGSAAALTLMMTARDGVSGRAAVDFSSGIVSSAQAQNIPNVLSTGGLVFIGVDSDGSAPRSGPLVDAVGAPPPDIAFTKPDINTNVQGKPTVPPPVVLRPTLDPAALAGAASQAVEIAPTAEPTRVAAQAAPTAPAPTAPPPPPTATPAPAPVLEPAAPPAAAAPAAAPAAPASADAEDTPTPAANPQPATSPVAAVNAPQQVNLLATMSSLATAQAAAPVARTPSPAAAANNSPAQRAAPASSPLPRGQASFSPVIRPSATTGLFVPWEVLAGIGGGLISAAIVLYALRRPSGGPS